MLDKKHEEFMKDIQEASKYMDVAVTKLYNKKPSEDDVNLYKKIIEAIKKINVDKVPLFENLIKKVEPDIENKIDLVQKFIISNIIISHLFLKKAENPSLFVTPIIMLIPYYQDNDTWFEVFTKHALPNILNNDLI
jgi:hypothetical protein